MNMEILNDIQISTLATDIFNDVHKSLTEKYNSVWKSEEADKLREEALTTEEYLKEVEDIEKKRTRDLEIVKLKNSLKELNPELHVCYKINDWDEREDFEVACGFSSEEDVNDRYTSRLKDVKQNTSDRHVINVLKINTCWNWNTEIVRSKINAILTTLTMMPYVDLKEKVLAELGNVDYIMYTKE